MPLGKPLGKFVNAQHSIETHVYVHDIVFLLPLGMKACLRFYGNFGKKNRLDVIHVIGSSDVPDLRQKLVINLTDLFPTRISEYCYMPGQGVSQIKVTQSLPCFTMH